MDNRSENGAAIISIVWLAAFYISIIINAPFAWILFVLLTITEAAIVYLDYITEKEAGRNDSRSGKAGFSRRVADSVPKPQQRQHH